MARNTVQFQKGLSEPEFEVRYGTEDQCREAVMRWRWPSGFACPVCAGEHHSFVKTRALYQCTDSKGQDLARLLRHLLNRGLNPAFKWVNTTLGNIKSAITKALLDTLG